MATSRKKKKKKDIREKGYKQKKFSLAAGQRPEEWTWKLTMQFTESQGNQCNVIHS